MDTAGTFSRQCSGVLIEFTIGEDLFDFSPPPLLKMLIACLLFKININLLS